MAKLKLADALLRIKELEAQNAELSDREMELQFLNRELQTKLDMATTERSPMPTIQDEPNQYSYE